MDIQGTGFPVVGGVATMSNDVGSRHRLSLSLRSGLLWAAIGLTALMASVRSPPASALTMPAPGRERTQLPEADLAEPPLPPAGFYSPQEPTDPVLVPESVVPSHPSATPAQDDPADTETTIKVTLRRDRAGNYVGMGTINNKPVRMLVDTGASIVIIPEPLAKRIGLKKGKPMTFRTGGGTVMHYSTELDTLSIGAIRLRHVPAAINPQMREDFALLGMSALALLRFGQEGDDLVLSYDPGENAEPGEDSPPPAPVRFRRSVKECMGAGKVFDRKTLNCLQGD